jgi:excisionase family DNA binding protein
MNTAVNTLYAEYLEHTGGDTAAAASLALAAVLMQDRAPATPPVVSPSLTIQEAAARLKVAPNTVYRLVEQGKLKYHRVGRAIRILATDIDAYQQEGTGATQLRSPRKYRFNL